MDTEQAHHTTPPEPRRRSRRTGDPVAAQSDTAGDVSPPVREPPAGTIRNQFVRDAATGQVRPVRVRVLRSARRR